MPVLATVAFFWFVLYAMIYMGHNREWTATCMVAIIAQNPQTPEDDAKLRCERILASSQRSSP